MTIYANNGGNSGVADYTIYDDAIVVQFKRGQHRTYVYTLGSVGADNLFWLKMCAEYGRGLNGFINREVKYGYRYRY